MEVNEDLELAYCLQNLFFETILPLIIIAGYFFTSRDIKAVIVNNYFYRFQSETKNGTKKWICCTDGCSQTISFLNDKIVKINGQKVYHDTAKIPPHVHTCCKKSDYECKSKLLDSELKKSFKIWAI